MRNNMESSWKPLRTIQGKIMSVMLKKCSVGIELWSRVYQYTHYNVTLLLFLYDFVKPFTLLEEEALTYPSMHF